MAALQLAIRDAALAERIRAVQLVVVVVAKDVEAAVAELEVVAEVPKPKPQSQPLTLTLTWTLIVPKCRPINICRLTNAIFYIII
jgi:hypothetical protein